MKHLLVIAALVAAVAIFGCGKSNTAGKLVKNAADSVAANKIESAVKLYEEVIKEYPSDDSTAAAYFELARLYQAGLYPKMDPTEQYKKSIEYYTLVYEKYPNIKAAPTSLFMTAFLNANMFNNLDEAKKKYELFLQKYPDHELALSAREELSVLGLSPEEILNKKIGIIDSTKKTK